MSAIYKNGVWYFSNDKTAFSHIGMIIHSTTLDTMAKVIEIYGGTTWIQHSGYVLRGATSGVTANSAVKTGGADTHTLTVNEMPSHGHNLPAYNVGGNYTMININADFPSSKAIYYGATQSTGGGQAHNNLPSYKSVYIWERTA